MAAYTALFDACALYPAPLRDLFLTLGKANLFRARWSDAIHEEWITSVLNQRPDLKRDQLDRTRILMNQAIQDCLVTDFEDLIPGLKLPDENDRHVLAAAIRGRADVIVTFNLKDFPEEILDPYGMEALHPDEFLSYQIDLFPGPFCVAVKGIRVRLKQPPKSAEEYLDTLQGLGLPQTVSALREFIDLL